MRRSPRPRLSFAAVVFVAAAAGHASSPPTARADTPGADGANDDSEAGNPGQDARIDPGSDAYQDADPSALTDFQATLDPHGAWGEDPTYGTVWTPSAAEVGVDFAPYVTGGHWDYENDYVWVSDYAWGWAAFHYGRWVWILERGWAWIPGRLYADAWVAWRVGDESGTYVGWAPMAPKWGWLGGVAVRLDFVPVEPFVFCSAGDIFARSIAPRVLSGPPAVAIAAHARPFVKASPVVGAPRSPTPHGPPPASLGVDTSRFADRASTTAALLRARQFARPSTAQALGARLPAPHVVPPQLVPHPYAIPRATARPPRRK